jgi:hypothetical protein
MDASIRLIMNDLSEVYKTVVQNGGFLQFKVTGHSIFAATHKTLYDFFPSNLDNIKQIPMSIAGALLIYNTDVISRHVIFWWCACALNKQCHVPTWHTTCKLHGHDRWNKFAGCHRYDQSTLNILLSNLYQFDVKRYLATECLIVVQRWATYRYQIQYQDD